MLDEIIIRDMEAFGYHGVLEEEKGLGQKFLVSANIRLDASKAIKEDKCEYTVDYGKVCKRINEIVGLERYDLIEALAGRIAEVILLEFAPVKNVIVEVKKPWAPVKVSLDTASVRIERGWHDVYIGVGSNMGDSLQNIKDAMDMISSDKKNRDIRVSDMIKTKPYGVKEQDDFLNCAAYFKTIMQPKELLYFLQDIEKKLKRERIVHWGPRTIDLDILFYDDMIYQDDELIIPHPEINKRDFVLQPLCNISPHLVHPLYRRRVSELLDDLKSKNDYERTI
ncbi:MAG: 2-amino-4-hydroxy-6-hydroxymethyldihydropteridine diphosphokinase [Lachnospiraceae bacterium]|nr:2-amino-4-hydroxy-6-hydroxymethyldihydropteridine diphosphokinase [Lachnospiraceae bacterium]